MKKFVAFLLSFTLLLTIQAAENQLNDIGNPTQVDKGGKKIKNEGKDKEKQKNVNQAHKRAKVSRKRAKQNAKWKRKDMDYRARTRLMFHKWFNTKPGKRANYRKSKHNRRNTQH